MSAKFRAPSAVVRQRSTLCRYCLATVLAAVSLLIQGCAASPPRPFKAIDASDPNTRVPAAVYRPVLGGYASQRPVEPASWRGRDDRVPPASTKDGQ